MQLHNKAPIDPGRRHFLKTSAYGGALLFSLTLPGKLLAANSGKAVSQWCVYVSIRPDNSVLMASPVMDMGQHMKTAGPMLLAEELDLDWSLIEFTDTCPAYFKLNDDGRAEYAYSYMNTGGSHALRSNWDYMRGAGATVRRMLLEEAASRWQVSVDKLRTEKSRVYHPEGQSFTYGELAEQAAQRHVSPEKVTLKSREAFTIIGTDRTTVDIDKMVTGKPLFGIDAEYPGMLHAVIARSPFIDGQLVSHNAPAAKRIAGVKDVIVLKRQTEDYGNGTTKQLMPPGVAVVADKLWAAMQGKNALAIKWRAGPEGMNQDSEQQLAEFHRLVSDPDYAAQSGFTHNVRLSEGDAKQALTEAADALDATYEIPLFAHACMEPFNCIADVREDGATIVVGHQFPEKVANNVATTLGISPLKVEVVSHRMGGGFGRRWEIDFVLEAVMLSKQLNKPVKVTWMREDTLEQDQFAPAFVMRVRAGLDENKKVVAWHHCQAQTRGDPRDSCFPFKLVPNYLSEHYDYPSQIATGPWRAPGHMQWAFAAESMLDELAYQAKEDPLAFRLKLMQPHTAYPHNGYGGDIIDSGRMAECYAVAAKMADWNRPREKGVGLGIAGHFTFGSYAAFVVEVAMDKDANLQVRRAWGAIDCGIAVNPNHIENQMQGGFIDGLSAALFNKVNVAGGEIQTKNFHQLRLMKMLEAPTDIQVRVIHSEASPTGVGEPPIGPAAAALANAIFAASGKRLRRLPFADAVRI
ncbi:molybdopterin-dependent oxidoreductase [Aliiglaciecola sp. CAU 1673]|uniref:xanthine dehydrogenase family protein molybdopterin-binding subunit n=1 Tax=Aliiglaciecola sp. CAU 1673 TaxID=3032595 RepID=UPI0023D98017|nr:molybdopterin cofactor-binding domain-containing protein [Aliiglaciecola sp. CAU 1673]MDF2180151.1 molybdopterin-dependent oxidoreductase [Aliiglaciecola sp. CAU 1673]